MKPPLLKGALSRLMVTTVFMVSGYVPRRFRVSEEANAATGGDGALGPRDPRIRFRLRAVARG